MVLYSPLMTFTEKMLDVTTVRHQVIANNISNVNTPGYKRSEVSFSEALDKIKKIIHDEDTDLAEMQNTRSIDEALVENLSLDQLYSRSLTASNSDAGVSFALADATFDFQMSQHPTGGMDSMETGQGEKGVSKSDLIETAKPYIVTDGSSQRLDGNNVSPEVEVAKMIKNTSFYNVLVSSLAGEFRTLKTIISSR